MGGSGRITARGTGCCDTHRPSRRTKPKPLSSSHFTTVASSASPSGAVDARPPPPPPPPPAPASPPLTLAQGGAAWRDHVQSELRSGWLRAEACRQRALQPRPRNQRFVSVVAAREQMHKNKFVVLDALYIATVLRRALIEPTVQHSRLGEENRTKRLYLRAYWDLEPLCRRFDIVPYALYARYYAPKGERAQRRPHPLTPTLTPSPTLPLTLTLARRAGPAPPPPPSPDPNSKPNPTADPHPGQASGASAAPTTGERKPS